MKKQITRVSPFQSAKVMAVLYFVLSLPFALFLLLIPMSPEATMPKFLFIVFPIIYLVIGFVFTLVGAWIYNLVAARVGGFEFTVVNVAGDTAN